MASIKTVQLPVEVWQLLKELAASEDRSIQSYVRSIIRELHQEAFTNNPSGRE
jgi:hypothetical protein